MALPVMQKIKNNTMRKIFLLVILSSTSLYSFSQQKYSVSYEQLKEYEGLYEYVNHSTLKIAASPKDTLLYAVINESKYKLTPSGKDLFLNRSKQNVQFYRNKSNAIAGYIADKDTFKLLNRDVCFSQGNVVSKTSDG